MDEERARAFLAGFSLSVLSIILVLFLGVYILSPIDGFPGPVDDIILAIAGINGVKKINQKKRELK